MNIINIGLKIVYKNMDIEVSTKELLNLRKEIKKNINKYIIFYQKLQILNRKMKNIKINYEKYNKEIMRIKSSRNSFNDLERKIVYNFYKKHSDYYEKEYEKYSIKFMRKNIEFENFKQKLLDDNFYEKNNERFDRADELIGIIQSLLK